MKKVISLFLVMAMLTAMLTVSFNALSLSDEGALVAKDQLAKYEAETGEELETQRLYFQMPNGKTGGTADEDVYVHRQVSDPETGEIVKEYDELVIPAGEKAPSWYSEYNIMDGKHYAGVYWWTGPANAKEEYDWCGYRMEIEDYDQGIYYVDIPIDVTTCIFNNGVDGGTDDSKPIFNEAAQTVNVTTEGLDPGDPVLTYGTPKANDWLSDGCIAIINPNGVSINEYSNVQTCGYDWYVYYGNGCYGIEFGPGLSDDYPDGTPDWSENVADICRNPDHFKNGVHVGYQPDTPDDPTEPEGPKTLVDEATNISVTTTDADVALVVESKDVSSVNYTVAGKKLGLFDISLTKDGAAVQPGETVTVKIPCDDASAKVYRIEDDGAMTDMNAVYEDGYLVFTTDHFSLYAAVGAESERDNTKLYFDSTSTGWDMDGNKIGFYAFPLDSSVSSRYSGWFGKALVGSDPDGDGIWEYDPKNFKLQDGVQYKIIFTVVDNKVNVLSQTYDLFFDTTCLGNVAYCDGRVYENPTDSSKTTQAALWRDLDDAVYGPVLQISSIGNVVGTCLEQGKTAKDVFNDFAAVVNSTTGKTALDNAIHFVVDAGKKTEQQLIDDIGTDLGLTKQDVYDVFTDGAIATGWDYAVSTLPGDVVVPTEAPTDAPTEAPTEAPTDAPTEAHVHTPGAPVQENVVPATCAAEGSYDEVVYCSECGEELSREHKTIEKLAHTPGEAVRKNEVPATCAAEGSYDEVVYCTVCGEELSREHKTIDMTAHTLKFKPGRSATATADGYKSHFQCSVCGKYFADANATREVQWEDIVVHYVAPTEKPTDPPTEAPTDPPTEAPTEPKVEGIRGDVDNSGEVDIVDVTIIQRADVGIIEADDAMKVRGDVDKNGSLEIIDATLIQRWLVDLEQDRGIGKAL